MGIQIAVQRKVHATPPCVQRWDGALGTRPKGWNRLPGMLCSRLQSYVDYGPPKGRVCQEVGLLMSLEALGLENCLSKDTHPKHLPGLDENGGMYGGRRSFTPQV